MRRTTSKRRSWPQLALMALLTLASVILLVSAVFARYETSTTSYLSYQAKEYAGLYLWSGINQSTGTFRSTQSYWTENNGRNELTFVVSNGTSGYDCAEESQQVYIRLFAALALQYTEGSMPVTLGVTEEDGSVSLYSGTARSIAEDTPLYETFGPGWFFVFYDEYGEEVSWRLEGGRLSALSASLTVEGVELEDTTLLQLQVSGEID